MIEKSEFKGFTLLELIVAMAIIAVLIGLSLLGIQTVQRSSRDTERRTTAEALNLEITDYYGSNNAYPDPTLVVRSGTTAIKVGTKQVGLKDAAVLLGSTVQASTSAGSVYCYTKTGSTYSIGVNLESGTWFNLGNSATKCSAANI